MNCPKCKSERIEVSATHWVLLVPDGTDYARCGDEEWDGNSAAQCQACDWSGQVKDLEDSDDEETNEPQQWTPETARMQKGGTFGT